MASTKRVLKTPRKKAKKASKAAESVPKVTQKRFKSRKKKPEQVLEQAIVEPEPAEESEIIPDASETDSVKNDLVAAEINEEIPVPVEEEEDEAEIEVEVKEEPPVVEEVKQESSAEATPK